MQLLLTKSVQLKINSLLPYLFFNIFVISDGFINFKYLYIYIINIL